MNKVKKRRLELEFTQYDVEKLSRIKQSRLSLIEAGYRRPNNEEEKILAKVLRTDVQELFE